MKISTKTALIAVFPTFLLLGLKNWVGEELPESTLLGSAEVAVFEEMGSIQQTSLRFPMKLHTNVTSKGEGAIRGIYHTRKIEDPRLGEDLFESLPLTALMDLLVLSRSRSDLKDQRERKALSDLQEHIRTNRLILSSRAGLNEADTMQTASNLAAPADARNELARK